MKARILLLLILLAGCASETKIGILSDIGGEHENVQYLADKMDVDAIIITGDIALRDGVEDQEEIYKGIKAAAKVPVYVLPGNHDLREPYQNAIRELQKKHHIIDLTEHRTADLGEVKLVSNPYGTDYTYSTEGYKGTENKVRTIENFLEGNKPILLVSHQPPKNTCADQIFNGSHVGDETLRQIMLENDIEYVVAGHIHESGGRACTHTGAEVPQNKYVKEMILNPGAVEPWAYLDGRTAKSRGAIITFKDGKAKYEIIEKV